MAHMIFEGHSQGKPASLQADLLRRTLTATLNPSVTRLFPMCSGTVCSFFGWGFVREGCVKIRSPFECPGPDGLLWQPEHRCGRRPISAGLYVVWGLEI